MEDDLLRKSPAYIVYKSIKCQHCPTMLTRVVNVKAATCFPCKTRIRKARDSSPERKELRRRRNSLHKGK